MKNHCWNCAYKQDNPGDAHITCTRTFEGLKLPKLDDYGVKSGWCMWPLNFDPVWVGKCEGYSKTKDSNKIRKNIDDPLLDLIGIIGNRGQ